MQYLLLIYGAEKAWSDLSETERNKLFGDYMTFTNDIKASGHYVGGNPLQPVHTATTVRVRDGKTSITDGPFAETKEQLGGFYMIEARDLNEAIRLASKMPPARVGSIEVRPLSEDFAQ